MLKWIVNIVILIIAGAFLGNKFYSPNYCGQFSGKEINHSDKLLIGMSNCQDKALCEIGETNDNILGGVKIKNWECVPVFGEIEVGIDGF